MISTQILTDWVRANQAVTSSTALVNVTNLVCQVEPNRAYGFHAILQFSLAGVASGFKFGVAGPASPTNLLYQIEAISSGLVIAGIGLSATLGAALAVTGSHMVRFSGLIENGANAGNLAIQFAQNVSDLSAINILRGSWLKVWNLS